MKDLQQDLNASLIEASKEMSTLTVLFHQTVAVHLGLNITDHKCLDFILSKGRATAGQLADWSGLTTGAITSVLNRLTKAGYVRRTKDPADLRIVYAEPVYAHLHKLKEVFGPLNDAMLELYGTYKEDELRVLLDYMLRANRIMRNRAEELRKSSAE
ncbi:MarR family transcriptional regulator [Paenibacillus sp. HB172176]|uniref:MarR family winged helix-turn-helix transcriptional regulator n=1 Tax=Paenibacillus sp. HB172176 TaxID=2493690 RepID=UPI001438EECA|nr:MarR family transcriptional regulator [Paenibacillus sp. HB172176]